jgi:hypothetical protein
MSLSCLQSRMARQPAALRSGLRLSRYTKLFIHLKGLLMKPRILFALFVLGLGLLAALAFGPSAIAGRTNKGSATACACGGGCECEDCACTCEDCDGRCTDCAACCNVAAMTNSGDESPDARPSCCTVVRQCCVEKRSCCD